MIKKALKAILSAVFWTVVLYINGAWALYFLCVLEKKEVVYLVAGPIVWCMGTLCYPFHLWKEMIAAHHWAAPGAEWEVMVGASVMVGLVCLNGVLWGSVGYVGILIIKAVKKFGE